MHKKLIIFGAGEFATLARFYFEHDAGRAVEAFVVDQEYFREPSLEGLPIVPLGEAAQNFGVGDYDMHVAISYAGRNTVRQRKYEECRTLGYKLATYVSSKAVVWPGVVQGDNCLILEQTCVQPTARIGANVLVGVGNLIGHRTFVRDHSYISTGVCIGGNCDIGERAFLGLGAIIRDHCRIGADSFVTMGAHVTRDTKPNSVLLAPKTTVADDTTAQFVLEQYFPEP